MTYTEVSSPPAAAPGRATWLSAAQPLLMLGLVWGWAIWACAEYWRGNPNYSYGWSVPVLVAGFTLRRLLIYNREPEPVRLAGRQNRASQIVIFFVGVVAVACLEYCREEVVHPIFVIWSISLLAVGSTLIVLGYLFGTNFARWEAFPICFFLTAVPWPPRVEQPIMVGLMRWVALTTTELLHWLGVQAQASGGAIALRDGLVGITEACSGIRSLQAGVMFGLAMGEWFLLNATRRVALLLLAVGLAVISNLGRTLALTLQANEHGTESIDRVHDLFGTIAITAMVLAIWLAGKLLAGSASVARVSVTSKLQRSELGFVSARSPLFGGVFVSVVIGLVAARAAVMHLEKKDQTQKAPFFTIRIDDSRRNRAGTIPKPVWDELHPASGEYIHHEDGTSSRGADCFHFFWEPSPWNRFALVHRPDICMPGVGWQLDGPADSIETELSGQSLRFYVFRFHRDEVRALELWGAWRNGEPVPIDYRPDQVLGASAAPSNLHLEGKRRSATEIVSCSIVGEGQPPSLDAAVNALRAVFNYSRP